MTALHRTSPHPTTGPTPQKPTPSSGLQTPSHSSGGTLPHRHPSHLHPPACPPRRLSPRPSPNLHFNLRTHTLGKLIQFSEYLGHTHTNFSSRHRSAPILHRMTVPARTTAKKAFSFATDPTTTKPSRQLRPEIILHPLQHLDHPVRSRRKESGTRSRGATLTITSNGALRRITRHNRHTRIRARSRGLRTSRPGRQEPAPAAIPILSSRKEHIPEVRAAE